MSAVVHHLRALGLASDGDALEGGLNVVEGDTVTVKLMVEARGRRVGWELRWGGEDAIGESGCVMMISGIDMLSGSLLCP